MSSHYHLLASHTPPHPLTTPLLLCQCCGLDDSSLSLWRNNQNIVARNADPFDPVVVTVGSIHGGTVPNAIASTVAIGGTVRCK